MGFLLLLVTGVAAAIIYVVGVVYIVNKIFGTDDPRP